MSEADDLEALIRQSARRSPGGPHPPGAGDALGQCDCGARITTDDLYGERGGVDLGVSRRTLDRRLLLYRCPLCSHTGELPAPGDAP
jgi:hypothetical protein